MKTSSIGTRVLFISKLGIGIALLAALLLWDGNWRRVLEALANTRPLYLVPFLGISFLLMGVSCLKWGLFLREQGIRLPFQRLYSLYLVGTFFNNFLPGMVGGDLVRAYVLGREIESHTRSIASVALERITGMIALVTLGTVFFMFNPGLRDEPIVASSIGTIGVGCVALLLVLWRPELARWFLRPFEGHARFSGFVGKLTQLHDELSVFKDKPPLVLKTMGYSYIFHILAGVNVYLAALVLDIPLSLADAIVLTPIILLVASIPVSVNGLGVWEWAFSVYLAQAGMQMDQGLAVALILRAKNLLVSLFGGLIFVAERDPARGAKAGGAPQAP